MAEPLTIEQLRILRCARDRGVATAEIVARDVFGAPVTTFGRTLKRRPAAQQLAALARPGFLKETGVGLEAEFALTPAGRERKRAKKNSSSAGQPAKIGAAAAGVGGLLGGLLFWRKRKH